MRDHQRNRSDSSNYNTETRKQEMKATLKHATEKLGKSPTLEEFDTLDFDMTGGDIRYVFGTWNDAKRAAGLEVYPSGRDTVVSINKDYFKEIDTTEKAYWLGTLNSASSISDGKLTVSRLGKPFFLTEFAKAVESEYAISERETQRNATTQTQYTTTIHNSVFIDQLKSSGHPDRDSETGSIPQMPDQFRAPFVRGYIESTGYSVSGGWKIGVESRQDSGRLHDWLKSFGVKRTMGGKRGTKRIIMVTNEFDINSIFETCWPDGVSTEPSYSPYPQEVIDYLNSEYPFPENVDYLTASE
ncbi:hypothetical protein [environmental halophage 1 AAJ-2005]|nr:hypothetical protein [environmental halophage 1 AAJ-2005]